MNQIFRAYNRFLTKYPLPVQIIQTALLMGTGDVCAQVIVEKKSFEEYCPRRTLQFVSLGFFLVGPAMTVWYRVLAKYIGTTGKDVALKKVLLDQLIFAPTMMVIFLSTLSIIQHRPCKILEKIERDYVDIMIANYRVWPLVQLVNFYLVPTNYQVLLVQSVAILWNTYISWKTQICEKNKDLK